MRKNKIAAALLATVLAFSMTACTSVSDIVSAVSAATENAVTDTSAESTSGEYTAVNVSLKDSDYYTDRTEDKDYTTISFSGSSASVDGENVTVSDGEVTINKKGTYVLTGDFTGTLVIAAGEDANVYLVMQNVSISATDGPAIYEQSCDKLIIQLPEGTTNSVADSSKYSDTSESGPTAAIYCKDDLTINGSGTLNVTGNYNDGITTKDDLVITGGTINVTSADDGILGRDSVTVTDGTITINAGGHGIKTTNDEDDTKGSAEIAGGTLVITSGADGFNVINTVTVDNADITVTADDDGMHADDTLTINGGKITITKSYEGLEATYININGGDISVYSSDDGLNAAGGNDNSGWGGMFSNSSSSDGTPLITITGGTLYVNASGDGIDSNGNISMTGGYVVVSGPANDGNNATDYQNTFTMDGGVIIASGSSGMYQSISSGSSCASIDYICSSYIAKGTEAKLYDGDTLLYEFTIDKQANAILIASDALTAGNTYTLVIGNDTESVTASEGGNYSGSGFGGMGGGFGDKGGRGGQGGFGGGRGMR